MAGTNHLPPWMRNDDEDRAVWPQEVVSSPNSYGDLAKEIPSLPDAVANLLEALEQQSLDIQSFVLSWSREGGWSLRTNGSIPNVDSVPPPSSSPSREELELLWERMGREVIPIEEIEAAVFCAP